jgi:hypothetical protein
MPQDANNIPLQQFYGVAISWGLGLTTMTIGGANVGLVQSNDDELGVDTFEARDQRGTVVQWTAYNPHDTATIEYIVATSGSYDSGTASITYPTEGSMVTIGADASDPISGSNWLVQSVLVRKANTDAAKVQLKVLRYAGVTQ